jgi:hypothetical protein
MMNIILRLLFIFLLPFLMISVGCSRDKTVDISGSVKVDGESVSGGTIAFSATDASSPVEGAVIMNGIYCVKVTPGEKIVKINGTKEVPFVVYDEVTKKSFDSFNPVSLTPAQYDSNDSPLRITIKKGGEVHDFDIPSEKTGKK